MTDSATPVCDCHSEPMFWKKDKRLLRGGSWICRIKTRAIDAASYQRHREKRLAAMRNHYQKNADERRARTREYRQNNHEQILTWHRGHYAANREAFAAYNRQYYAAHREEIIAKNRDYYAANSSWLNLNRSLSSAGRVRY